MGTGRGLPLISASKRSCFQSTVRLRRRAWKPFFGNIAEAAALCGMTENGTAMLRAKDNGSWRIAAQVWDKIRSPEPVKKIL